MEARGVTQEDTDESREEFGWWVELFLYMEMSMEMRVGRKVEGGERIESQRPIPVSNKWSADDIISLNLST